MPTHDGSVVGAIRRFFVKLGHPLRWTVVDKCLATVGIATPLFLASYLLNSYITLHPEQAPYYNHSFMPFYLHWHEFVVSGWLVLGAVALLIRNRSPNSRVYGYAASQFGCITTAVFMYFPGYFTTPYLMGILCGGIMLLMFFDMKQALWGLASLLTVYVLLSVAIVAGRIPPAPLLLYPPYEGGRLALWWVSVNSLLCLVLMALMFSIMAFAIHQWHDREAKLEELSKTDALTRLANRRHFFEMLQNEVARALRLGRPLSIVICDADRFKDINDTHGHQAGDEVLRRIAEVLRNNLRMGIDTVGRIGGDEFAVILTETHLDGARVLADRISNAVRAQSFTKNGANYTATLSIGVVGRHVEPVDVDLLIEAADTMLYRAKRDGRDRVASAALADFVSRTPS